MLNINIVDDVEECWFFVNIFFLGNPLCVFLFVLKNVSDKLQPTR